MKFVIDVDSSDHGNSEYKAISFRDDEQISGIAITGEMAARVLDGTAVILADIEEGVLAVGLEDLVRFAELLAGRKGDGGDLRV